MSEEVAEKGAVGAGGRAVSHPLSCSVTASGDQTCSGDR